MPDSTAEDVISEVSALEQNIQGRQLREDIRRRRSQHALTDEPWLPDHFTHGVKAVMPTVEPAYLAQTIGADMSSYITTTTVIPGRPDLVAKADKVEKRYALERAALFPVELRSRMRWNQMITGFGVYQFGTGSVSEAHPWWVQMPDPNGTFFTVLNGCRPPVVGRRYTQTVREIERNQSYWDGREGHRPVFSGSAGIWNLEPIRFDVATEDAQGNFTRGKEAGEDVDFVELDNGRETWCVVLNRDKKAGMTVWHQQNLGGPGSHYMIVPGHMTDARELREMILPFLWAPMNIANQLQLIDTIRMTRSLNIKPQVLIDRNPELLQAARSLGIARDVPEGQPLVGDNLIEIDGHPYFWEVPSDDDLDKLEQRLEERLARYSQTQLALTTGEVVANVTVGGLQLALGARQRQQGPMLTFEDVAEARILGMVRASIMAEGGFGADDWPMFGRTTERYGKGETALGDYASWNRELLDFEHDIDVTTASKTREEAALEVQNWNQRKVSRLSTWKEGIAAAGYANEREQRNNLVQEEGYELAAQLVGADIAAKIVVNRWRERGGIDVSGMIAAIAPPAGATPGATGSTGANAREVPSTGATSGGAVEPEVATPPMPPGGAGQ